MRTTVEYFNKTEEELSELSYNGNTKEENLLLDSGEKVIFFEDIKFYKQDLGRLEEYKTEEGYEDMVTLKTVEGRLAVVLK